MALVYFSHLLRELHRMLMALWKYTMLPAVEQRYVIFTFYLLVWLGIPCWIINC